MTKRNNHHLPPVWRQDLRFHTSSYRKTVQIDDIDRVFTGNGRYDLTAFFRYPELYEIIIAQITAENSHAEKTLLSLPASVGCEAYSLAAIFKEHAAAGQSLNIHITDISAAKLRAATDGAYPYGFHLGIPQRYRHYFNNIGKDPMNVRDDIKAMVTILPPANIMEQPPMPVIYDMVLCLNLLCYLPDLDAKIKAAQYLTTLTDKAICISHGTYEDFDNHHDAVDEALNTIGWYETAVVKNHRHYKEGQIYKPLPLLP